MFSSLVQTFFLIKKDIFYTLKMIFLPQKPIYSFSVMLWLSNNAEFMVSSTGKDNRYHECNTPISPLGQAERECSLSADF